MTDFLVIINVVLDLPLSSFHNISSASTLPGISLCLKMCPIYDSLFFALSYEAFFLNLHFPAPGHLLLSQSNSFLLIFEDTPR